MDTESLTRQLQKYNSSRRSYYALVGTPKHTNIGDRAIAYAEQVFLKKNGNRIVEIPYGTDIECLEFSERTVIILHGGGNFGDIWMNEEEYRRAIINKFPNNKIVLMPQTLFFQSNKNLRQSIIAYSKHPDLTLVARERKSYAAIKEGFSHNVTLLTPDIVLYLKHFRKRFKRNGKALFLVRNDKEKTVPSKTIQAIEQHIMAEGKLNGVDYSDMHVSDDEARQSHKLIVTRKMKQMGRYSLVVTDRLHGMVFAAITGTPCIVLDSQTHKTTGVYEWLSGTPCAEYIAFCKNVGDAKKHISQMDINKSYAYSPSWFGGYWNVLASAIRRK